jgi:3-oxoacyl-[acyl-carrier protein] reductase
VLVAAAGLDIRESKTQKDAYLSRTTLEQWQRVIDVNLTGTFLCVREVLPHMIERGSGSIVAFSSSTVRSPVPGVGAYVSSKFGVEGLVQVLALEVGENGIRVNAMHPGGMTDTGLFPEWVTDEMRSKMHRPGVVRALAAYLASDESRGVTGSTLVARDWNRERGIVLCSCKLCAAPQ